MGHHRNHPGRDSKRGPAFRQMPDPGNDERNLALHRSVFAQLTRLVQDPDQPGRQISLCELEQRLRGNAYRLAASGSGESPIADLMPHARASAISRPPEPEPGA